MEENTEANFGHSSTWNTPPMPRGREGDKWAPRGNLSIQKVELSVLMWNVRGINATKKQQYLDWLIRETKLTSPLYLDGYVSHQTLFKRSGGCITFSNLKGHKKVKALGTYLNWSKVLLGGEEVHILNVYLEPGHEKTVVQRADKVIQLTKDIVRQDPTAKIIVGGDVNGMFSRVNTHLQVAGFKPALIQGTPTHREGN